MMHEYELLRMAMGGGGGAHKILFTDIQPVDTKGTMQWPVATRICAIIEMSLFPAIRPLDAALRQSSVKLPLNCVCVCVIINIVIAVSARRGLGG